MPRVPWTDEENERLYEGVTLHGLGKWALIQATQPQLWGTKTPGQLRVKVCASNARRVLMGCLA